MEDHELRAWAERNGVNLNERDLTNRGLASGKAAAQAARLAEKTAGAILNTALKDATDVKLTKREEEAIKAKTLSQYARREYARVLAAKETIKKDPSKDPWHTLPKVELRDTATAGPFKLIIG